MGVARSAYRTLVGKPKDLGIEGRIILKILKCILKVRTTDGLM
jgi:hypothetical protein